MKIRRLLKYVIGGILAIVVLATGWYVMRRVETSEFAAESWQTLSTAGIDVHYKSIDADTVATLTPFLGAAADQIEAFFGMAFPGEFDFYLLPDRPSLDEHWRSQWNMPLFVSVCWMVGSGSASNLSLLSPRAWDEDACEHDGGDSNHIAQLIAHELVHVFHDQVHPNDDIGVLESIGWFIEGLAVHVSGQLEGDRLASPREAIETDEAPRQLEDAWSGTYRYGVSGSMVAFIDEDQGREILLELMRMSTEQEILARLNMDEETFLGRWRAYVMDKQP